MRASLQLLVLLLVALNLQCLYAKYYLVETDGKASSVHRKNIGNPKHVVSSHKTSKIKTKTGKTRRRKKALSHPSTSSGTRKSKYYSGSHRNHENTQIQILQNLDLTIMTIMEVLTTLAIMELLEVMEINLI